MILEKTKQALQDLFPQVEKTAAPAPPPVEDEAAESKKTPKKEEPRIDGVVERDYKVHGYHLDAQVSPAQLIDAVTILDQGRVFHRKHHRCRLDQRRPDGGHLRLQPL